jgi:hypothetical protein
LRTTPASTVLDPIEISLVLLECAEQRCLFCSFDLMIVGLELQSMILSKLHPLGFAPSEVMLFASHTHNAPATDQACAPLGTPDIEFVRAVASTVEALVRRLQQQQPSEIRFDVFQGYLNHSVNRRRYWPFPTIGRMHGFQLTSITFSPNPSGPKHEAATVIRLRKVEDGQPLGVIWHYTCHPTAVIPNDVISSDYPGAARLALREHFGELPCMFVQGFCGNIRPDVKPSRQKTDLHEQIRKIIRVIAFGNLFPTISAYDWKRWSRSLADGVRTIAQGAPVKTFAPTNLQMGSADIALNDFFDGIVPEKMLTAQVLRIGEDLEIVALSAEPSVEWKQILDESLPPLPGRIRLYAGYLGALYGYLPTAKQVLEGGYEVEGFQPFFGLSGHFLPNAIASAVTGCVKKAFEDLNDSHRNLR